MYYHLHYGKWVVTCPLFRGCPLLRGNKCTITMGNLSFVQRLSTIEVWVNLTFDKMISPDSSLAPPTVSTVTTALCISSSSSSRQLGRQAPTPNGGQRSSKAELESVATATHSIQQLPTSATSHTPAALLPW